MGRSSRIVRTRTARAMALGAAAWMLVATLAGAFELSYRSGPGAPEAAPPLPPFSQFPVQLVLDDDGAEGALGVSEGSTAKQFLWFNRFSTPGSFVLDEIWVLFPSGVPLGAAVEIAVYADADANPANGASLVATFPATVQAADGSTFSIYPTGGIALDQPGDVLLGIVPRFVESGVTPPVFPAALDTGTSQARSWIAIWSGDPPSPPGLTPPPDLVYQTVDAFEPGNWMIRGFGRTRTWVDIPAAGPLGLAALGVALALAGALRLRRRR